MSQRVPTTERRYLRIGGGPLCKMRLNGLRERYRRRHRQHFLSRLERKLGHPPTSDDLALVATQMGVARKRWHDWLKVMDPEDLR